MTPGVSASLPEQRAIHACAFFDTPAEQLRLMSRHLADRLATGRVALGLVEERRTGQLTEALEDHGVDVAAQAASGALRLRSARSAYMPWGTFDPGETIKMVAEAERDALLAGYRGLCAAGDMSGPWTADREPSV